MIGISQMMEMKSIADRLRRNHPKFPAFIQAVMQKGIPEGTVLELKVIEPDGSEYITNLRVNEDDLDCIRRLKELQQGQKR
ncbi:MAG: hypothetical protein Q4C63_08795 [Eubacteriales bacterium]|nr:hypothetical protein [Eubacteriales bacterium]